MSAQLLAGVAAAGGVGAAARFVVDGAVKTRWTRPLPLATLVINASGSLLLGVLTGLVIFHGAPTVWRVVLGTGFCGGYTTFSTSSFETVRLAQQRHDRLALVNLLGSMAVTMAMAAVGLAMTAV